MGLSPYAANSNPDWFRRAWRVIIVIQSHIDLLWGYLLYGDWRIYFLMGKSGRNESGRKLVIGLMGSASGTYSREVLRKAYETGKAVAENDCVLITGACPGLPYETARGCIEAGGLSVGISPGLSHWEHKTKYHSPDDLYDILIFTGSGLMGREVTAIRSCDIVVIIGGRSGTLGEFSIAYDEGKLIGVVEETGGITEHMERILTAIDKNTGAKILFDKDPASLVKRLVDEYKREFYKHPSVFSD